MISRREKQERYDKRRMTNESLPAHTADKRVNHLCENLSSDLSASHHPGILLHAHAPVITETLSKGPLGDAGRHAILFKVPRTFV